jgi:hypothetical protein
VKDCCYFRWVWYERGEDWCGGSGEEVDGRNDDEEGTRAEGGEGGEVEERGRGGEGETDFFVCFAEL